MTSAHHIYHTKAIVLASRNSGEANKLFTLYTRELGLVVAIAQGIRFERSKLRFGLQDFSIVFVDLIYGKEMWRITSATPEETLTPLLENPSARRALLGTSKLAIRLMAGETSDESFFDEYVETLIGLKEVHKDEKEIAVAEFCIVLRMLHKLGYISDHSELEPYLTGSLSLSSFSYEALPRKTMLSAINRALRESHL